MPPVGPTIQKTTLKTQHEPLTQIGIQILPTGIVVEGPVQVGVAAHDAHNVRLLVGGEGLRPGGHWHFDGTIGGAAAGVGGLGRVGAIFAEGDRGGRTVRGHGEGLLLGVDVRGG